MKRRIRRFRVWLGLKILPANVLTLDVGPFIAGMQQAARTLGQVRIAYDTTPLIWDATPADEELEP